VIVWLLRHGIAEDRAPGGDDRERALTADGRERLERAGPAWRRTIGSVDLVFASPLRRSVGPRPTPSSATVRTTRSGFRESARGCSQLYCHEPFFRHSGRSVGRDYTD